MKTGEKYAILKKNTMKFFVLFHVKQFVLCLYKKNVDDYLDPHENMLLLEIVIIQTFTLIKDRKSHSCAF